MLFVFSSVGSSWNSRFGLEIMSKILIVTENGRIREVYQNEGEPIQVETFDIVRSVESTSGDMGLINKAAVKKFHELCKQYPQRIH